MTNSGTGPANKLEQLLASCENKALPEADAQKVVDRLDQVKFGYYTIADGRANLHIRV